MARSPRKASNPDQPSGKLPRPVQRNSLVTQATDLLRQNLYEGTWDTQLPGERQLCELLMISRPTLRSALHTLEKEGLLGVSQGRHRLIKQPRNSPSAETSLITQVIILCPDTATQMLPITLYLIDETYKHLQKAGYLLTVQSPAWIGFKNPAEHLARHVNSNPSACWALFSVSEAVQKWFSEHSNRVIVSGSCYPGVSLPCIDMDYRAVTNHAIGTLLRRGFKNISAFLPETLRPGDAVTAATFKDAIEHSTRSNLTGRVLRVSPNREIFHQQIKEHLSKSDPTGLYISRPLDTLYALSYLLKEGISIGRDIAVISGGDEQYLRHLVCKPAHYNVNRQKFATKFGQQLLKLIQVGSLPARPSLMMPDFVGGDTI